MLKVLSSSQKSQIIQRCGDILKTFKQVGNKEMWWHSQRMVYSLKHELVPQTVYVDQFPNFSFIISSYANKGRGKIFEVYPIEQDNKNILQNASESLISLIANGDISYGAVQGSPYFLYQYLTKNIKNKQLIILDDIGANGMTFPEKNCDNFIQTTKPIDGFKCRPLQECDADLVNQRYKYGRHPDTLKWIKKSIKTLPNVGCYTDKGDLVGQFIIMDMGTTGGLFVIDDYRRLKLGKWIVQEMVKLLHKMNLPIVLEATFDNKVSNKFFTDMGFETMTQTYYVVLSKAHVVEDKL